MIEMIEKTTVDEGGVDFEKIKRGLERLDETAIQETIQKFEKISPEMGDILGSEEGRYFALLGEKDEITLEHSVGVVEIASDQLEEFNPDLEKEGVSRETFLRACALHDIGKLDLPDCILKGTMTWQDFENKFFELKKSNPDFINQRLWEAEILPKEESVQDLPDQEVQEMELNYRDFINLEQCFAGNLEALQEIRDYHIDSQTTSFMDVLRWHEEKSRRIIEHMDIADQETVAELAGSHHHYSREEGEPYPQSKGVLRVSVLLSELVHLADVYHAISQSRLYKEKNSEIETLHIIMTETEKGGFQKEIAKRWVRHTLDNLPDQVDESEQAKFEEISGWLGSGG